LFLLLLAIFAGVALMAIVSRRFSGREDPGRMQQLQRWLIPLVGLMLVLSLVDHYVR
jgi:hypothetical protein